jgi:hypothetical protein
MGARTMALPAYTPGPWSNWGSIATTGAQAQLFYTLLEAIYSDPQVRVALFNQQTEAALKNYLLTTWGIVIPDEVRMMLVDIENATCKSYVSIEPAKDSFYVMVIPPDLRRKPSTDASYKEAQALSGAWFHATNDGWGM